MLYDIGLDVVLESANDGSRTTICCTNYREMYYSAPQLIAHHAVGGCKMNVGDLIGSGTVSGPAPDSCGSLLELSWSGACPLRLENGETRSFLEDGDRVTLHGYASTRDYRIGFGECSGLILPSPPEPGLVILPRTNGPRNHFGRIGP
jgi:fumarylacetoacetase